MTLHEVQRTICLVEECYKLREQKGKGDEEEEEANDDENCEGLVDIVNTVVLLHLVCIDLKYVNFESEDGRVQDTEDDGCPE